MDREAATAVVTELFRSWYPSVVRYAYHSCRSLTLAEDFAQEAFAAYYEKLRNGETIDYPRAWILQTIRNQASKHWRFQQRHAVESMDDSRCEFPGAVSIEHGFEDDPPKTLSDYLSELTSREEEVLLLRARGMKYREIAEALGITSNSVGTLMMRAVQKIRSARERLERRAVMQ